MKHRNMFRKLKNVVRVLKIIISFVLTRPFGKVIHDLAQNYKGSLAVFDFRQLEKLATKSGKLENNNQ